MSTGTFLIDIEDSKALGFLQQLETLHWITIHQPQSTEGKPKLSDKYRGVFTNDDAKSFIEHTKTMRNEWQTI